MRRTVLERSRVFGHVYRACRKIMPFLSLAFGCWPITVSGKEEIPKLTSNNVTPASGFGAAVAISEDYIVVGAPGQTADISGAAVVFQRVGSTWFEQQLIIGSKVGPFDTFGFAVAIDVDRIVIGAPHVDPAGSGFGFAYIFHRKGDTWVEETQLVSSGSADGDKFGFAVAMAGDPLGVGCLQPFGRCKEMTQSCCAPGNPFHEGETCPFPCVGQQGPNQGP